MGRYKPTFTDQELMNHLRKNPGTSATKMAERFNVSRQAMHYRLARMRKKGYLTLIIGAGRRPSKFYLTKNQPWRKKIHDKF